MKEILESLKEAGFTSIATENYQIRKDLQDFFLYSGKFQPEIYLETQVRANISTFSLLADQSEIESGLKKLSSDIKTGRVKQIIERHRNTDDYLFVTASV